MILTSTSESEAVPFTPAWREGEAKAPIYWLRAGSVVERGQLEAELSGRHRAGRVYGFELREAVTAGVQALLAGDADHDRVLALLGEEAADGAALAEADRRLLVEVRGVLAEHWPDYRDLIEQLERRRELAPVLAFRRFCTGWEHVPGPHATGRDGQLTEAALRGLDPLELAAAGNRAYAMLYAEGEAGNSARPDASGSGRGISSSDAASAQGGTLAGGDGQTIPA